MRQEYRDLAQSGGPIGERKFANLKANATTDKERDAVQNSKGRLVK